jgi:hypothetical protein
MSRWLGVTACALAIAAIAMGCVSPQSLEQALAHGRLENDRYTARDGDWSVDVPVPITFDTLYALSIREENREGDSSVEFGDPNSSALWLVKVSPPLGDGIPVPAEAARAILDGLQSSQSRKNSSVHVLDETETREAGRAVVSRVWLEEFPNQFLVWRGKDFRIVRVAQVEVRGDRIVVFGMLINESKHVVERDPLLPLSLRGKAWRDFIGSFRFEETRRAALAR